MNTLDNLENTQSLKGEQMEIPKFDMKKVNIKAQEISESVDEIEKMDSNIESSDIKSEAYEDSTRFIDTNTGQEITYEEFENHPYPEDIKIITAKIGFENHIDSKEWESQSNPQVIESSLDSIDTTNCDVNDNIESNSQDSSNSIEINTADKEAFKKGIKEVFKFFFLYKTSKEMNKLDSMFLDNLSNYIEYLVRDIVKEQLDSILESKISHIVESNLQSYKDILQRYTNFEIEIATKDSKKQFDELTKNAEIMQIKTFELMNQMINTHKNIESLITENKGLMDAVKNLDTESNIPTPKDSER